MARPLVEASAVMIVAGLGCPLILIIVAAFAIAGGHSPAATRAVYGACFVVSLAACAGWFQVVRGDVAAAATFDHRHRGPYDTQCQDPAASNGGHRRTRLYASLADALGEVSATSVRRSRR